MSIFNVLSLIGGLSLFLFGMNVMGAALERRAGSKLKHFLEVLTASKMLSAGAGSYGRNPEFFSYHGDGGRLCQFRYYDP